MDPCAAVILAAITIFLAVYLARHHNRVSHVRFLRRAGFGISVMCLGLFRLFLLGIAPIAASSLRDSGFSSLVAAASVPKITGGLYLASSAMERHSRTTPRRRPRTRSRPRAA